MLTDSRHSPPGVLNTIGLWPVTKCLSRAKGFNILFLQLTVEVPFKIEVLRIYLHDWYSFLHGIHDCEQTISLQVHQMGNHHHFCSCCYQGVHGPCGVGSQCSWLSKRQSQCLAYSTGKVSWKHFSRPFTLDKAPEEHHVLYTWLGQSLNHRDVL